MPQVLTLPEQLQAKAARQRRPGNAGTGESRELIRSVRNHYREDYLCIDWAIPAQEIPEEPLWPLFMDGAVTVHA